MQEALAPVPGDSLTAPGHGENTHNSRLGRTCLKRG